MTAPPEPVVDPAVAAQAFVDAVAWNEHTAVWDMLSDEARVAVLEVATRRGMDALLSARLREGTAATEERDDFLADLLHGLRSELIGVDLEALRYETLGRGATVAGSTLVRLVIDVAIELGAPVPVAQLELIVERQRWAVVRLDAIR